eukprot:3400633-Pyramimonas_sp.AAC.1
MGAGALKRINLGEMPEGPDEPEGDDGVKPEASPLGSDGGQRAAPDGPLRPWRVRGHSLLAAPIFADQNARDAAQSNGA